MKPQRCILVWILVGHLCFDTSSKSCLAETRTWDGKHDTTNIEVNIVYFVPSDRRPLSDWKDRVDYFCKRIEQFHSREFQGQSQMKTIVHPTPLVSESTTAQLRHGDANAIFFRTLKETDERLKFATDGRKAFQILLVLSDINWQPLDDFYRLKPSQRSFVFEGQNIGGQHFPGAAAGGARATYIDDRGVGWGLVSGDGWRVPYRGSDCVVYHEGCGHTVGLPHPEPIDGSVMGVAQYEGWISESFLNKDQKIRLGWEPKLVNESPQMKLFTSFRAIPEPVAPKPGDAISLKLDWPEQSQVQSLRVRFQTAIDGPWIDAVQSVKDDAPSSAVLGNFERETPVSYRIDATLENGATAELWGYLQVRREPNTPPKPMSLSPDLIVPIAKIDGSIVSPDVLQSESQLGLQVDLLELADPEKCWTQGQWSKTDGKLLSPKAFGSRLEFPYSPPPEYRLTLIVEPLDEPNGLLVGNRSGDQRFAALFSYAQGESHLSAIENIDGVNVGNETTKQRSIFRKDQLSQIIVTVQSKRVTMFVDGQTIADWSGRPEQLSLSDYWKTPDDTRLFIGAYDCRYRFHRISLEPLVR